MTIDDLMWSEQAIILVAWLAACAGVCCLGCVGEKLIDWITGRSK